MGVAALQIQLEDLHRPEWRPLYVGDRSRFATATSVRLLDPRTLVCCSLLARKIYLVRFDLAAGSHEVIDRADTTYGGGTTETDLCDTDGLGNVVTSNCELGTMSLYRREEGTIRHARDLPTGLAGNFCHGARFLGPRLVAATMLRDPRGLHVFELPTMQRRLYVPTDRLPKDVCFLPQTATTWRAVVIATDGALTPDRPATLNRLGMTPNAIHEAPRLPLFSIAGQCAVRQGASFDRVSSHSFSRPSALLRRYTRRNTSTITATQRVRVKRGIKGSISNEAQDVVANSCP